MINTNKLDQNKLDQICCSALSQPSKAKIIVLFDYVVFVIVAGQIVIAIKIRLIAPPYLWLIRKLYCRSLSFLVHHIIQLKFLLLNSLAYIVWLIITLLYICVSTVDSAVCKRQSEFYILPTKPTLTFYSLRFGWKKNNPFIHLILKITRILKEEFSLQT